MLYSTPLQSMRRGQYLVELAQAKPCIAATVVVVRVIGIQFQGLSTVLDHALELAQIEVDNAASVVATCQGAVGVGLQADRLGEMDDGFLELLVLVAELALLIVDRRL